jgi:transposase InsO family protein
VRDECPAGPVRSADAEAEALTRDVASGRHAVDTCLQRSSGRQIARPWLTYYNFTRPHGGLSHKPPGSRLTNVVRNDS